MVFSLLAFFLRDYDVMLMVEQHQLTVLRLQKLTKTLDMAEYSRAKKRSSPVADPAAASQTVPQYRQESASVAAVSEPEAAREAPAVSVPAQPVIPSTMDLPKAAPIEEVSPKVDPKKETLIQRYFDFYRPENKLETGIEVFDYSYREEGFMKLDGPMYGVFMDYRHRFSENPEMTSWADVMHSGGKINLLKVDLRLAGADDIKYRSERTGQMEGENHYAFETRVMGGYEFPWKERNLLFVPYAGVGYRYLLDDNGGRRSTTGNWSYDRESHYFYVPLGIEAHKFYASGWKTRLTTEYDLFMGGRQYSHMEDDPNGVYKETLYNKQERGYGLRGALRLAKETERFEFFIEPFVRYWHIYDSEIGWTNETAGIEPNNRTHEYGTRMGVRF